MRKTAFIRSKTVKGNKYYYLVQSRRVGGKVSQRVLKYLGANPTIPSAKKENPKKKKKRAR